MNVLSEKGIITGTLQYSCTRDEEELTRERWCEDRETRSYKIVCRETGGQIAEWVRERDT